MNEVNNGYQPTPEEMRQVRLEQYNAGGDLDSSRVPDAIAAHQPVENEATKDLQPLTNAEYEKMRALQKEQVGTSDPNWGEKNGSRLLELTRRFEAKGSERGESNTKAA